MHVVIAGGNGFIGRELTAQLIAAGHEVTWLSHRAGRLVPPAGSREVWFLPGNLDATWAEEVANAHAVVNLSGAPIRRFWTERRLKLIRSSRIEPTEAIVAAIAQARAAGGGPQVLVNASAAAVYGDACDRELSEDSPLGDDFLGSLCIDWEDAALAARDCGCRVVTMRHGVVLGEQGFLPRMARLARMYLGGPMGTGRQWVSWIHIADLAALYRYAIDHEELAGAVNAVAPNSVRMSSLSAEIGRTLHRPSWLAIPLSVLQVFLGDRAEYTIASQRMRADKALSAGFKFRFPTVDVALDDLLEHGDASSLAPAEGPA